MNAYLVGQRVTLTGFGLVGTVTQDYGASVCVHWDSGTESSVGRKLVTVHQAETQELLDAEVRGI